MILFNLVACNKKDSLSISDEQLDTYFACLGGVTELRKRGEDIQSYASSINKQYGDYKDELQKLTHSIKDKTRNCSPNKSIDECLRSSKLDSREQKYFLKMLSISDNNQTKTLDDLHSATAILCADLRDFKN